MFDLLAQHSLPVDVLNVISLHYLQGFPNYSIY